MTYTFKLTVHDMLKRPHFKKAKVIAGQDGIYRVVNWVHIVEIARISHLLNGNELILSTGIGWGTKKESCLSFVKQLIERNSAGLCIELGTYFSEIPEEMIHLADEHRFPLIVFPDEVRFIDITQDVHSVLHETEKRRLEEDRWVRNWLQGRYEEQEISRHLRTINVTGELCGFIACIGKLDSPISKSNSLDSLWTRLTIVSRSIFAQLGFQLLSTYDDNEMIYILIDQNVREDWKQRLEKGIAQLKQLPPTDDLSPLNIRFGIGKMTKRSSQLHISWQTAQQALDIQQKIGKRTDRFYDDLHTYRLMPHIEETGTLREFVLDYLQPVIDYDEARQGDMMHTLKTFLACNGSKQETAARLFIVRQTLYHRLEKLQELLGPDFMTPDKRLAIEFAITAYEYLHPVPDESALSKDHS